MTTPSTPLSCSSCSWTISRSTSCGLAPGQRLFESLFVFENYPVDRDALSGGDGLSVQVTAPFDRTGYPLMLLATPADGLRLQLTYDTGRFAAPAMERLLDLVVRLADDRISMHLVANRI